MTSLIAPLTPLAPHHRLAWLEGVRAIRCYKSLDGFDAGRLYRIETRTQKISSLTIRLYEGKREKVLVSGGEFFVIVLDSLRRRTLFTDHAPPTQRGLYAVHDTATLSAHFEIPHVPDISEVHAERYESLRRELSSF